MRMEETKGVMGSIDQFPIGMRVLAVDDDPVCLKLLEALLHRCKYHVTTTNQAIKALNLLRENKDKFDLVISDVHMPDMDGFKLLERVGLEMDLPVIMLSTNGETKTVMKGITHGACDYLLKPVRLEELKNIWQHVIRRKTNPREKSNNNNNNNNNNSINIDDSDSERQTDQDPRFPRGQNGQSSKKRKDQNEGMGEEDEGDENNNGENDDLDSSAQKKPRVVWSVDLHRKFVAAVHQLGIDKAVPKRILEIMNVEKLTRENVASHLQKYRLYLKRLSAVASQQASLVAAFGGRGGPGGGDPSYLRMFDGLQSYHPLATSSQVHPPFHQPSHHPSLGLPGLPPSLPNNPLINPTSLSDLNKFHLVGNPNQPNANLLDSNNLPNEFSFSNIPNNNNNFAVKNIQNIVPSFESRCVNRIDNKPIEISSMSSCSNLANSSDDITIGRDMKCESSNLLSFGGGNNINNNNNGNNIQKTNWRQQDDLHESSLLLNSFLESQIPNNNNSCTSLTEMGAISNNSINISNNNIININNNIINGVQRYSGGGYSTQRVNMIGSNGLMGPRVQNGYGSNGCSFDGLLNSMIKMERDEISFSDGDMGACDLYPLGAHI